MRKMNLGARRAITGLSLLLCISTVSAQKVEKDIQISVADVVGNDESEGIDIMELTEHKIVVQEAQCEETPFTMVEQMPRFVGGETEMYKFMINNLVYPKEAVENGVQGRVIVRFVIDKEGKVKDVKVLRGIDPACDNEAKRVVSIMPDWTPGKQNGRAVATYFTLPFTFRLPPAQKEESKNEVNQGHE